ncbi:hypothetical protein DFH07DRAFT_843632 [Mycena maculata]|uniref:Uncharacterized protein n=1 Tax=Mycena maculata TaxID=230809 RepID=A0AAD7I5S2_9AGAR|nr:hypothetical protein DFH07DRAFT_843632 [Mycena maculata]
MERRTVKSAVSVGAIWMSGIVWEDSSYTRCAGGTQWTRLSRESRTSVKRRFKSERFRQRFGFHCPQFLPPTVRQGRQRMILSMKVRMNGPDPQLLTPECLTSAEIVSVARRIVHVYRKYGAQHESMVMPQSSSEADMQRTIGFGLQYSECETSEREAANESDETLGELPAHVLDVPDLRGWSLQYGKSCIPVVHRYVALVWII